MVGAESYSMLAGLISYYLQIGIWERCHLFGHFYVASIGLLKSYLWDKI